MDDQHRSQDRPTEPLETLDEPASDGEADEGYGEPRGSGRTRPAHDDKPTQPLGAGPGSRDGPDPLLRAAMEPANRARLLIATAVVTAVNMLLLLLLLAVTWTGPEHLVVDGERCMISEVDGENVLFCER